MARPAVDFDEEEGSNESSELVLCTLDFKELKVMFLKVDWDKFYASDLAKADLICMLIAKLLCASINLCKWLMVATA